MGKVLVYSQERYSSPSFTDAERFDKRKKKFVFSLVLGLNKKLLISKSLEPFVDNVAGVKDGEYWRFGGIICDFVVSPKITFTEKSGTPTLRKIVKISTDTSNTSIMGNYKNYNQLFRT